MISFIFGEVMDKKYLLLIFIAIALVSSFSIKIMGSEKSKMPIDENGSSYSTWFTPEGEAYKKFSGLINEISDEYDSPKYEPHVTLQGGLVGFTKEEVISKATKIAQSIEPFTITLTKVTYPSSYPNDTEAYYRSLYILAETSEPLMKANQLARKMFGREDDPPYNPHLSIIYGPFPSETKEEIISKVGREFNESFKVDSIYVWSDKGLPHGWKLIKKIPLGKK